MRRTTAGRADEPEDQKYDRIFQALPPLVSPEYLRHLRTASAVELPAPVLVRAFRQLLATTGEADGSLSRASSATLQRLLATEHEHRYFRPLRNKARRLVGGGQEFEVEDLIFQAKQDIAMALVGPRGKGAEQYWASFQVQRLVDTWREQYGRRGERIEPKRADPQIDQETGMEIDVGSNVTGEGIDWHGNVAPDKEEWFRNFVRRTLARISDDRIREVAQDQWGDKPSRISSTDPNDASTLCRRYDVSRFVIGRWLNIAAALLYAALESQDEMDLDIGWIKIL